MQTSISPLPPMADVVSPYLSTLETAVSLLAGSAVLAGMAAVALVRWRRDERAYAARMRAMLDGTTSIDSGISSRDDREYWLLWTAAGVVALLVSQTVFAFSDYQLLVAGRCVAATVSRVREYPYYYINSRRTLRPRVVGHQMLLDITAVPTAGCDGSPLNGVAAVSVADERISADVNHLANGQIVPFVVSPWWPHPSVFGSHAGTRPGRRNVFLAVVAAMLILWLADPRRMRAWLNRQAAS